MHVKRTYTIADTMHVNGQDQLGHNAYKKTNPIGTLHIQRTQTYE